MVGLLFPFANRGQRQASVSLYVTRWMRPGDDIVLVIARAPSDAFFPARAARLILKLIGAKRK